MRTFSLVYKSSQRQIFTDAYEDHNNIACFVLANAEYFQFDVNILFGLG